MTETEHPPAPPRLDYAPGRSLVTRIGRRRLVWLAIIGSVVLTLTIWSDPVSQRFARWRAERSYRQVQQSCLTYTAPADRVVYEEDPAYATDLLKLSPSYAPIIGANALNRPIAAPMLQPPVMFTEPLWTRYSGGVHPIAPAPLGAAFMGERTTRSGERRLVCVGLAMQLRQPSSTGAPWSMNRWLQAWSFKVGSLDGPDQLAPMGQMFIDSRTPRARPGESDPLTGDPRNPFNPPFPLRLYAGQPDPNDRSRFTIGYELQGRRGVIAGRLHDNGTIEFIPDIGWRGVLGTTVTWIPELP